MPLTVKGSCRCRVALRPRVGEHLEVHVPQPGDVAAVGVVVVYGDEDVLGVAPVTKVRRISLNPTGFLMSSRKASPIARLHALHPPERTPELPQAPRDLREPHPSLRGHGGGCQGVVDVVKTGQPYPHGRPALRRREQELRPLGPFEAHPACPVGGLGPREVAAPAVVDADVPHVHGLVD
jgi:hypothetical protein